MPQTSRDNALMAAIKRRPVLWAGLLMVLAIFLRSFVTGQFGQIGIDGDDVMRLVQIRDYLDGQSWFNTDQLRLGGPAGTDMHWSRLVDLPIILLTSFFDIFTNRETALMLAISIWPPLTAGLFIFAMAKVARYYSGGVKNASLQTVLAFTLILLAFFVIQFFRFEPGAIDHHNIQMGLVALAMAGALDPKARFFTYFLSGLAVALSIAIGTEVYLFGAVICGYVALNWFIKGDAARRATQGYGLGLSLGLLGTFFATINPSDYSVIKCDSLSFIVISAGCAGGFGLALAAQFVNGRGAKSRYFAGGVIALTCLIIFALQAPQCMANPLSDLPEDVTRLWLNEVQEARPLWDIQSDWLAVIPLTLGPALLAIFVLARQLKQDAKWSARWLVLFLIISATALSIYQIRFNIFSYVFGLVPLAAWTAELYNRGKAKAMQSETGSNIAYIGALALSVPLVWLLPASLAKSSGGSETDAAAAQVASCYSAEVMAGLNTLPKGRIASTSNGGSEILYHTGHSALSGNYHRNIVGISAQIRLATSEPAKAHDILREMSVDYLHFCKTSPETQTLIDENKDGLYAGLKQGEVPDYLSQILSLEDGGVQIYKVSDLR